MSKKDRVPMEELGWTGVSLLTVSGALLVLAGLGEVVGSKIDWDKFGVIDACIAIVGAAAIAGDRFVLRGSPSRK